MASALKLIPRALLFGNPMRNGPQISPDGNHISFLAPYDGVLNIWVASADDLASAVPITRDSKRGIRFHAWVRSGTHILFSQDNDGDENYHIYCVRATGGDTRDLTPFDNVQARFIRFSRGLPQQALIGLNRRDRRWHDVFRVNLTNGELQLTEENEGYGQFFADDALQLRVATKSTRDGGYDLLVTDSRKAWVPLLHVGKEDALTTRPVAFGPRDRSIIYMLDSRGRNTAAAMALDVATGATKLLGEHPKADVVDLAIRFGACRPMGPRLFLLRSLSSVAR